MRVVSRNPTLPSTATVTTAVDKSPASARLSAVATAGDLPTAPTPRPGTRPTPVAEVCRKMGVSEATYFRWKLKYGGLGPSELRKLRQFEEENQKLKRLVADLSLDKAMLQEVLAKKV